ncbi:MAG: phosphoglucosamine mutase, partial [Plesiomonas shigelloides]
KDLTSGMTLFPQVLENVRFSGNGNPLDAEAVKAAVIAVEEKMQGRGRVLLRKSGTEPLIRVMVEGEDLEQVRQYAKAIAAEVQAAG